MARKQLGVLPSSALLPDGTASFGASGDPPALETHVHPQNAGSYGPGSDGAVDLTQSSAAPAWASKSGSGATTLFTLVRDVYATTLHFDAGSSAFFLVKGAGYRIFATISVTIDAGIVVHNDGAAAVTTTPGGNCATGGTIQNAAVGAGTAGGVNTTATQATGVTNSAADTSTAGQVPSGGAGGAATGGGTGGGVAGGTMTNASQNGQPYTPWQIANWITAGGAASVQFRGGAGGTGGNATGGTTATGGAGGAGAQCLVICTLLLVNNGTIRCQGGAGSAGTTGNGTGAGGGGGGGGGAVGLLYGPGSTVGTVTVAGGAGGALAGGGANGANGAAGIVYQCQVG